MCGHQRVRHERPRGRRPDQQGGPRRFSGAGVRSGGEGEAHVDRGVGDRLVALGELVVGQTGPATGAVRRDAVVLHQQPTTVDLLQGPPDRLDVLRVHGPIGRAHVDPAAHPVGHLRPEVDVALDGLAAPGVELGDAEGLDVGLAGEAELLLDRELDRKPVAVPTALAVDLVALHRPEAREGVLERARLDVVGAGASVGGGRALVERPGLLARVAGDGLLEDVLLAPESQHLVLEGGEVDLWGNGLVGSHCGPCFLRRRAGDEGTRSGRSRPRGTTLLGRPSARRPASWVTRVGPPQPVLLTRGHELL